MMEYDELLQQVIEFLGTFAFAISGIRHAAAKHFDWFGGYVCGIAVAIGGGTIRDVMLGTTPFWMTNPFYIICTAFALVFVVMFAKHLESLRNTWFVFDTLGLALFNIAGIQKSLLFGQPYWVAIIMGCITGVFGFPIEVTVISSFVLTCLMRFLAVRYHLSLPILRSEEIKGNSEN